MADLMYRLVLKAQFESAEELERAVHGLERLQLQGAQVTVKMGEVGRAGALGLDTLARSTLRVGFMFNMLESAYMRVTMAQLMSERAQDRYNATVEKYGLNSEEARKAARQLELQMNYLNHANMRANVSMGLMLTQLVLQSKLLTTTTLAQIAKTTATAASTVAGWLHNAMLAAKAKLLAILSGGLAVPMMAAGGLAMAGMLTTVMPSRRTEVNVQLDVHQEADLDAAFEEAKKQATYELRRQG